MPAESPVRERTMQKIVEKIYSVALTKVLIGRQPRITVPEFKHMLATHRVKKKLWYRLIRSMESQKMGRLHGQQYFEVHLSMETLSVVCRLNSVPLDRTHRTRSLPRPPGRARPARRL